MKVFLLYSGGMTILKDARKPSNIFLVDVEASGPTPYSGLMTEFGVVDFETGSGFYAHLYDFTPHHDHPALPLVKPGASPVVYSKIYDSDRTLVKTTVHGDSIKGVMEEFTQWLTSKCSVGGRPIFVSDNNGFDNMFMAYCFDSVGLENPFGFSSRRISDFYAGLEKDWRKATRWKRYRVTKHTHNPYEDSLGNYEALKRICEVHNIKI